MEDRELLTARFAVEMSRRGEEKWVRVKGPFRHLREALDVYRTCSGSPLYRYRIARHTGKRAGKWWMKCIGNHWWN